MVGQDAVEDGLAAAAGQVDIEEDDVGEALADQLDGGIHLVRLADDLDGVAELGPHAGPEDGMVLDEEDPGRGRATGGHRGSVIGASSARPRSPRRAPTG